MRRLIRQRLRRRVVVTLKSGAAFRGLLFDVDRESVVLRDTEHLNDTARGPIPVDGELLVLRADIDYLQVP